MKKVITYGSFDLFHTGHARLLQRAKELGDYLIVGVTSDDYDRSRGKINLAQSLNERIENVRSQNIADEIIVEEYEGQKIDDIIEKNVDIFAIGSDWKGKFDYLQEYCQVVYLDRTEGISSSLIRSRSFDLNLGLVGSNTMLNKIARESSHVNGLHITQVYSRSSASLSKELKPLHFKGTYEEFLDTVDAVYICSVPELHYERIKMALEHGKHVLCESPLSLNPAQTRELFALAEKMNLVFMDALKTAYNTAYNRLLLLLKSRKIGDVISVETTCTSLAVIPTGNSDNLWGSLASWGPYALLPIFQILGTNYASKHMVTLLDPENPDYDRFTRIDFVYPSAVASMKVGKGVKSEGEMIITGTKGYVLVPAPWWKAEEFELRFEDPRDNRRYFYAQEGEGIREELVRFVKNIADGKSRTNIEPEVSIAISKIMDDFTNKKDVVVLEEPVCKCCCEPKEDEDHSQER